MLFKSFALFAAFTAVAPAFAAPVSGVTSAPLNKATSERLSVPAVRDGLVSVNAIVENVLNNATVKVLSTRDNDYHCSVVEVKAKVTNILNNLHVDVLSKSKRGEEVCSLVDIEASMSLCLFVTNIANDMNISILSNSKRTEKRSSGCDDVKVTAIAEDILNKLNVKVLSNSKRDTKIYSVLDIAVRVYNILNNLTANVVSQGKRAEGPHSSAGKPSVGSEDFSAAKEVVAKLLGTHM
ncbi:hypothetical protein M405DRAFT_804067 [Rhizopogon salebrosus TDB-379]|nr:hypothetical protein M405DRAFT_804067 [Rhizopogon salebrosus TDB-379]